MADLKLQKLLAAVKKTKASFKTAETALKIYRKEKVKAAKGKGVKGKKKTTAKKTATKRKVIKKTFDKVASTHANVKVA